MSTPKIATAYIPAKDIQHYLLCVQGSESRQSKKAFSIDMVTHTSQGTMLCLHKINAPNLELGILLEFLDRDDLEAF